MNRTLIISGGSITHGGWSTWKDFVLARYGISDYCNLAKVGIGNESIINRAMIQSTYVDNPLMIIMLTNVDKWEWYVHDQDIVNSLNTEKHTISQLHDNDGGGYWSTGSHFPSYKEYYKENYYSHVYQLIHTVQNIIMLQAYCNTNDIPLLLLCDSPIFECYEHELNMNPTTLPNHRMLDTPVIAPYVKMFEPIKNSRGLIGFCVDNKIPWYHPLYKGHPGSQAHYAFAEDSIFDWSDNFFDVVNNDQSMHAKKMNKLWEV